MDTTSELIGVQSAPILQELAARRTDLVNRYHQALRETLFSNRSEVRPAALKSLAASEAETLFNFLQHPEAHLAQERGVQLCQAGLSESTVLRLSQATRQFLFSFFDPNWLPTSLEAIEEYHQAVIQGFLQSRERIILSEQERIRSALQRTLNRYSLQMEVAASVAWATTAILDLDTLMRAAVELIRERFDLYYVGIFLTDETNQWAVLRAGTGEAGQALLGQNYRLEVGGASMVGLCIAHSEPRIALDVGRESTHFENPLLPDTHSEAAIPLRSRGKILGALNIQSQHVGAFTEVDTTVFRILADQLVNGIENARLFDELRHSEGKYRTILENIQEGYYELDLAGKFTFGNDSLGYILGRPKEELLGESYQQFVDPEYVDKVSQAFARVYQTSDSARGVEYRLLSPDETARFVETSATLIRDTLDQPVGLRGIVRDITGRKQAEQMLIERKALERSNKELEQFAYVASHDLQEPLRKIQAFGDRLRVKNGAALSTEGRDYLERMLIAANRMQNLINDLLALSRVSTKAQPFAPVQLAQVANEVISDLETLIERTNGRVEIGSLPTLDADPLQMRQLLQNLIGNGLKFHPPDRQPVIKVYSRLSETSQTAPLRRTNGIQWNIIVEDNGIGFDEKYLSRIFQPFQRLHSSQEYPGTGMGLAICHRIVERHGGQITAKSQPGQGAKFIVKLPAQQLKGDTSQ